MSRRALLAVGLALSSYACSAPADQPSHVGDTQTGLVLSTVAEGLVHPWDMAFLSPTQALLTEKNGTLVLVDLTSGESTALTGFPTNLDSARQDARDNAGLFGIALDPSFLETGWVYVAYSAGNLEASTLKVIRFRIEEGNGIVDVEELFHVSPSATDRFHYGGGLAFGSDGMLYITAGDRVFDEIDQPATPFAQDVGDMRGKIYRLHPDGTVPDDNPDFGQGAVPGLYAIGIRASQGLTVQPSTGDMWFSEHGSVRGDEINVLHPGANYGWPAQTTGAYRNPEFQPPVVDAVLTPPAYSWEMTVAPTGLTFVAGERYTGWTGDLIVPGLSSGSLWRLDVEGREILSAERLFQDQPVRLRRARQSPDGWIYLLTDEAHGRVLRIEAR